MRFLDTREGPIDPEDEGRAGGELSIKDSFGGSSAGWLRRAMSIRATSAARAVTIMAAAKSTISEHPTAKSMAELRVAGTVYEIDREVGCAVRYIVLTVTDNLQDSQGFHCFRHLIVIDK